MIVKKLTEGISYDEVTNSYNISFQNDSQSDIINLMAPEIYEAEFLGNVYYFGYKFKDSVPSKIRSNFIHWLKGLKETKPTDYQYREIIAKPLRVLDRSVGVGCALLDTGEKFEFHSIKEAGLWWYNTLHPFGERYAECTFQRKIKKSINGEKISYDINHDSNSKHLNKEDIVEITNIKWYRL